MLGAGGVLGAAWAIGALVALEEATGVDVRDADEILGTSAGAVVGALVGCGVSASDLFAHQQGIEIEGSPLAGHPWDYDIATGGTLPPRPQPRIGAGGMLLRNVRRIPKMPPATVLAALTPLGRGSLAGVGELVAAVTPDSGWAPRPGVAVVALDYDSGHRVLFGRPGQPRPPLPVAVMASASIPGWFAPQEFGGRRYIDGGAWSPTSADLMTARGRTDTTTRGRTDTTGWQELDEVVIIAPTTMFGPAPGRGVLERMERRWRTSVTRRCLNEAMRLHAKGIKVTVLGPGPEDVEAIGTNVMDTGRRLHVMHTAVETQREVLMAGRGALHNRAGVG